MLSYTTDVNLDTRELLCCRLRAGCGPSGRVKREHVICVSSILSPRAWGLHSETEHRVSSDSALDDHRRHGIFDLNISFSSNNVGRNSVNCSYC